jgi:cytochrome oxidase Cu insertion factor (SCO1/SenC/PrrC family)
MEGDRPPRSVTNTLQSWLATLTGSRAFWAVFIGTLFLLPIGRSLARTLPPAPSSLGDVEPFELTDQYGSRVGSQELAGHVWVIAFLPPDESPEARSAVETVRTVLHRTKNLGPMFHVVTLPTDPAHASEAERKALVEKYCSSSQLWSYLGGTDEDVVKAARHMLSPLGYVRSDVPGVAEPIVLVDTKGRVRGVYGSDPGSIDRLMQDVSYVANIP